MIWTGSDRFDKRGNLRRCPDPECPDPFCMVRCEECGALEQHDRDCSERPSRRGRRVGLAPMHGDDAA